jgi:exodeoxyribonuclease VII small subunit
MPKAETTIPPDIAKLSFEEAMTELDRLVRQLEDGKAKLDDAIGAYERGSALKRHCEARLKEAQMKIEKIALADGAPTTAPFGE